MSGLDNLRSVFQDELNEKVELFKENQPIDKFDTKFNYNQQALIPQSFTFGVDLNAPILDSLLRGRNYEQIRFSQDFSNENLFVSPERPPFNIDKITQNSLGLFDPRSTTPKQGTLYFNVNNSFNPATNDGQITFQTAGGVDKGTTFPYSRLEDLGKQFISDGLSYQVLYNDNHTPKNQVVYQGQTPISYQNVNRDNLKIGNRDRVIGGQYGFSRGNEPYVISPIGDGGRDLNKGGRSIPITRASTDRDRILNFLTSPKGLSFATQQNINVPIENTVVRVGDDLVRTSQRFGVTYNPLSTLAVQASRLLGQSVPNILIRKSGFDLGTELIGGSSIGGETLNTVADLLTPTEYGVGVDGVDFSINDTFTGGSNSEGGLIDQISNAISSLNPFDSGTTIPKPSVGDKHTLLDFGLGDTDSSARTQYKDKIEDAHPNDNDVITGVKDGMPFYFKDMRDGAFVVFRAYIEGLTENITPSYAPHNYIGRSEPVYVYERGEREISFSLKLVAQTKDELKMIYKKMDRLTSMCYPEYINEGETGYGNRMKPPLTKLRYGDLFGKTNNELQGYIKSLNYAVDQSATYDVDLNSRVPRHITVTIGYQVIHSRAPRLDRDFDFYGYVGDKRNG